MLSRRRFAIRAVLVLVLVSCVRPDENAKIGNHDVVAFTISKEQEGQQKVSAELATGEHVACEFEYKTSTKEKQIEAKPVEKEAEPPQPKVTAASVMKSLNGRCTSTDRGFWTYEVCIGKSITQKHQQERYVMGRTVVPSSDPSSKFQKYVDGEVCGAVTGEPKRETTITYACGDIFGIRDVSETSTCVYSVVVTDKSFCGVKGFSKVPAHSSSNNAISLNSASDTKHENWYLEISPYGPYLRCAIYCVDEAHEGPGSGLNFHKFQTKMYVEDDEANIAHKAVKYKKHVVKKIGRQTLRGPGIVDLVENGQPGGFALSLQGSFRGSVQQFTMKGHVQ